MPSSRNSIGKAEEAIEVDKLEITCMSCKSSHVDEKFTKNIMFKTCTFCSWWCQCDYEYDVRKEKRVSFYGGYEKQKTAVKT
jgi:hypothetical protein